MADHDLHAWVTRARSGDRQAFAELVTRFERRMLAYFLCRTPSLDAAEELAQETFVRAYTALEGLSEPARFPSWLFGIARNAYREWARRRRLHQSPPELPPRDGPALLDRKVALHKDVYRIVQELPDPYREVLLLRYFGGASTPEIAARLDRPLGTVTKQVSRAHALVASHVKTLRGHTTLLHFLLPEAASQSA